MDHVKARGIFLASVCLVVVISGCSNPSGPEPVPPVTTAPAAVVPTPDPPSAWREAHRLTVEEAAYRFQFHEYRSEPQREPLTYCLARTENDRPFGPSVWTDPPPELMQRFRDHRPPVKRRAVCQIRADLSGVTDVETGGRAVIFRVVPPLWLSDTEVLVDGGYYYNGLSASGKTYTVRFIAGEWIVVDARWRWIS